jgi:hypothetical protein
MNKVLQYIYPKNALDLGIAINIRNDLNTPCRTVWNYYLSILYRMTKYSSAFENPSFTVKKER